MRMARHPATARMNLQQLILETRAALETPIDFADLVRRGVLERASDAGTRCCSRRRYRRTPGSR